MNDRKEQILDAAEVLLMTRSYSAFSYQHLSDQLGIRKASIHHHFPTKEALGVALTDRFVTDKENFLAEINREHDCPWEQLQAYMKAAGSYCESGRICSVGILQAEHNVIPASVREGQSRLLKVTLRWTAELLEEGRRRGVMAFSGSAQDKAILVQSALQGALQNARAEGIQWLAVVADQLKQGLTAPKEIKKRIRRKTA